ncbi:MAG: fibronectin type III domain-containing protein, partial [Candidatus Aenigmarchaeota archaeon]|nr:fibronectin type III domain-containing protein [Candidatus Aenigmarchaeota archaeon]
SFTFKDVIPPATTINPNGASWTNANIPFTLACTDTGGGSCQATYYKIIDSAQICIAGGFSTGNSGTVTCPAGSVCQRKVCFYSTDTAGNTESIQTSNIFQIDKTLPVFTVNVLHSPAAPTDSDTVTFTASASDTGSGLSLITIYVDGAPISSCGSSPCVITSGTYASGTHTYYAIARDTAGNQVRDPPAGDKQFTVTGCTLTSVTITPNCAGGSSPSCEVGESISMSAATTGNCGAVRFFQIDASGTGCSVQYSGGDLQGISQNNPVIGAGTVTGTWTITSIPNACSGKTVTASAAALYNPGPPPAGLVSLIVSPLVTGSFTFKDVIPPATTINPNGASWTNANIPFTLACTDTGGGSCQATYYKVIDDGQPCGAGFSSGLSGTVTCPAGSVCRKRVCYYSTDTAGNTESTKTSNIFQIDKASPSAWLTQPSATWTNLSSFTVSWSGSDGSGTGISNYNVQYNSTWADGIPVSGWADWLPQTSLTSVNFGPSQNNYTYYFRVNATDNVGNAGPYSAERSISIDTELPNVSYTVNDDKINSIIRIDSVAWDNVSGIFNHTITCIVTNPSSTIFVQCPQAGPFGRISTCQTPQISYSDETEINCEIRAQDRAGNLYSRNIFFASAASNLIMKLYEHNIFISLGETYHIRIQLRNV